MTENAELDLVIERTIKAPRSAVWQAWSDPRYLSEWWCPKPWFTEVRGFNLCPGGAFDTLMHGPAGEESPNPGVFLEIVPQERIVFSSTMTAGWRPADSPFLLMTAIIMMDDNGKDTDYRARVLHANKADRDRHEEMGFNEGWGICIDQLEQVAQKII